MKAENKKNGIEEKFKTLLDGLIGTSKITCTICPKCHGVSDFYFERNPEQFKIDYMQQFIDDGHKVVHIKYSELEKIDNCIC